MPSTGVKLQTYNLANTTCNFDPPPLSFRKMQIPRTSCLNVKVIYKSFRKLNSF